MNSNYRIFPLMLVSILLSFLVGGCIDLPTNLKAPQWDVDLNVPLVNRSYTLNDIIKQQKYLSIQGTSSADSIYVLQSDTYTQSADVSNFIQLNTQTSSKGNIIPVVNSIDTSITIWLPVPEGAILQNAVFSSGSLLFNVSNNTSIPANITVTFPRIVENGSELVIPVSAPANLQSPKVIQKSLGGDVYNLSAYQPAKNPSSIPIIVSASSSTGSAVSYVTMDFYSSNFDFSSATGYLPEQSLGVKSQQFSLNLGDAQNYGNKASLQNAELEMDVKYYSPASKPFSIKVDSLNIIGVRSDGSKLALQDSTGSSNITFTIGNGITHLTFTQANSNITSFISFLPSTILLSADYIMNPSNSTGTVTNKDSVVFSTNFSTKSILALQKTLLTDTTSINISNQDSLKIQDARSAYINVNVQNGIPLNAWLTVNFVDSRYKHLFSDSLSFNAAAINTAGEVTGSVTTNNLIQLDSVQATLLARAHYAIVTVTVQTSGASSSPTQYVAIRPDDLIQVTVYGGVQYHVNTNDLK